MRPLALSWLDAVPLLLYLGAILLVGLRLRRRMVSTDAFLLAGRSLPSWATGIAFMAANCGALEVMGIVSTSAKYGARAVHFYWLGAIPAMLFLALFMMPIYRRSRVRSVPEFLKLRYGERTRAFNAACFAVLMVLVSGISLYAMAIVLGSVLGWSFGWSVLVGASVVLVYVFLGGLRATIYNEVLQFVLIVAGLLPLALLALRELHGFSGVAAALPAALRHAWKGMAAVDPASATMDGFGTVVGLGFVLSFGYWCTDFLLVQRALAARDLEAAVETPLIAAVAKLFFPLLVVVPGLAAFVLFPAALASRYDLALPQLMLRYYGPGLLGLGITAMLASFMSGMAGNVTAFNTVWTCDLYQAYLAPGRSDRHYLRVGRGASVVAVVLAGATAFLVLRFNNLMDYVQLLFSFFNAPLFATFLLGMFTRWATPAGGFAGLVSGTAAALGHYLALRAGLLHYGSDMSANFYGAAVGWGVCFLVTVLVSLVTPGKPDAELAGLVYDRSLLPAAAERPALRRAWAIAAVVAAALALLNWAFY
ncbi:MAG TPA: sodium:solute symporter family protein [Vicinamibacteria bacterium]|nr:sodium:solute symporter family protein [Vicinamibacteria bacterium]